MARRGTTSAGGACRSCESPLPAEARFCMRCGTPAPLAASPERRVVSVLFADINGFTHTSERVDAEVAKALLDDVFSRLQAAVTQYEGTVDKLIGDGLMAVFG